MIRVTGAYPDQPGMKFDDNYYLERHIPLVRRRLADYGLVRAEVDKGISGGSPGSSAPFARVAYLYFPSADDVLRGLTAAGVEIMGDIPNYTNVQPQIQISEIVVSQ